MKTYKNAAILLLSALFAMCGCQSVEPYETIPEDKAQPETQAEAKVFTATIESEEVPATKTVMDAAGNVLWSRGDKASVFAASTLNALYQVTDESAGQSAATLKLVSEPAGEGESISGNVAFYPYSEGAAISQSGSSYVISGISLPATQTYAASSFGNEAFAMAAVTASASATALRFKNILGGLKLQIKGSAAIASISISGNAGEVLCGEAAVTASATGDPAISLTDATATAVTLSCGSGVQLSPTEATTFIIALPPVSMTAGFTLTLTDTGGGQMEIKTNKAQTIKRSKLLKMPALSYVGTVDLGLPSGLKWASSNLCESGFASAPEESGDYFAWGELEPYYESGHAHDNPCTNWREGKTGGYDYDSYKWIDSRPSNSFYLTKYNTDPDQGVVDGKTQLSDYNYADDAARKILGGAWRLPTIAEWQELMEECTWTWTTLNEVKGVQVTGPGGGSIFLPAAGTWAGTTYWAAPFGDYLSATIAPHTESSTTYASSVYFYASDNSVNKSVTHNARYNGCSIRPVLGSVTVTGVSIDQTPPTLLEGETAQLSATVLPDNASFTDVSWQTSNEMVAKVDASGLVTARSAGTATITAVTTEGGKTADCVVTVTALNDGSVYLELPSGTRWASRNLCTTGFVDNPEDFGDYYAWGATTPIRSPYHWTTYPWCNNDLDNLDYIYFNKYYDGNWDGADGKTQLDYDDDAARQTLGGDWRMPTAEECQELVEKCTWTWTTLNGVKGMLVTGPNGNSIFLPGANNLDDDYSNDSWNYGYFWSSTRSTEDPNYPNARAYALCFTSDFWDSFDPEADFGSIWRCEGLSIRPVRR